MRFNKCIIIVFLFVVISCNKENKITSKIYPNYSQLKVGNSWIYQRFNFDSLGIDTATNIFDSCYVEKDTIINGKTYFKLIKPVAYYYSGYDNYQFLRDSLDCIVNSNGQIIFSSENTSLTFYTKYEIFGIIDTMYKVTRKMDDTAIFIETPSGNYNALNSKITIFAYPNFALSANPRFINNMYVENIGLVLETIPFFACCLEYTERRLVRYHIQ